MTKQLFIGFFFLFCMLQASAQLQANFTIDKPGGCSPLEVRFTNTTTGAAAGVTYTWDFDNGNSSTLVNPGATYIDEKTYSVTLTAINGGIKSTISKAVMVYRKPSVDFSASPLSGCTPLNVNFNSTVSAGDGTIANYFWDFGDGNTAQGKDVNKPSHSYTVPQQPPINLTVTNSYGCYATVVKDSLVQVFSAIQASFEASPTFMCSPQAVRFKNTSTGSGRLKYIWDFGDGSIDSVISPSHLYKEGGTYTARLTVRNESGCAAVARTVSIRVGGNKADFTVPPVSCSGDASNFSNRSTRPYDSVRWQVNNTRVPSNAVTGNMSYRFIAPGTYTIKLVAYYNTCTDTIVKTVTVGTAPALKGFQVQSDNSCGLPVTFTFTDTTSNAVSWIWKNNDNTTMFDTTKTAVYTFNSGINDRIGLTVTNADGCTSNFYKTIQYYPTDVGIIIKKSTSPPQSANRGCPGLNVTFSTTPPKEVVSFAWNLGDGTTSNKPEPSHVYNQLGNYQVSLDYTTKTGCKGTVTFDSIYITQIEPFDFGVSPSRLICGNSKVIFTPTVALPNRDYIWLINGTEAYYSLTPDGFVHRFQEEGIYTISLVMRSGSCSDTVTKVDYITVVPPFPDIQSAVNTCAGTRGMVEFTDTTRKSTSWTWDFGDGGSPLSYSSFRQKVSHTYAQTGKYTVILTGTNGDCTVSDSMDVYVLLKQKPLLASASAFVCTSDSPVITLSNYETHPAPDSSLPYTITKLQFGDLTGSSATIDPGSWMNSFTAAIHGLESGKEDIRIITTSEYFGCADTSNFIKLKITGPVAGFSFKKFICYKQSLVLRDTSHAAPGSPIVKWEWLFGDSTVITATDGNNVSHQYKAPGIYRLGLRITDAGGCVYETPADSAHLITVAGPAADFEASAYDVIVNDTVFFANTSVQSDGSDLSWLFSDGSVTTDKDTYFLFDKEGDFPVKLIATNRSTGCSDTAMKTIHVKRVESIFDYDITYTTTSNCPPVIVNFHSRSVNATRVSWLFGDGGEGGNDPEVTHVYTNAGIYKIVLYSYDSVGHVDSAIQFIEVKGPYAILKADTLYGCNVLQVKLSADTVNAVSFKWDFGDGTITASTDTFAMHRYTTPGVYIPALILIDSSGCSATSSLVEKIVVDSLHADFNISPDTIICDSAIVAFTPSVYSLSNEKLSAPVYFEWVSAMHTNDTLKTENAAWHFNKQGSHDVRLTVRSDYGCKTTITKKVVVKQGVVAGIGAGSPACTATNLSFFGTALPAMPGITWQWDFGNNMASNLQNPNPVVYPNAGPQRVTLVVSNGSCIDTARYTVDILNSPAMNIAASKPYLCLGDTAMLTASGGISCKWTPAVSSLSNNGYNAVVNPAASAFYTALITDSIGCTSRDSVEMKVIQPLKLQVKSPVFTCAGTPIRLTAEGAATYQWTGEGFSSTEANPFVSPAEATTYKVVGTDAYNCFTDSAQLSIEVGKLPEVNAGPDQKMIAGQEVKLATTYSSNVVQWTWMPGNYLNCTDCPTPLCKPKESIDYLFTVTSNQGCKASDTLRIEMICGGDLIYIPSGFTPNGDNLNDRFAVHGSGMRIKRLAVFDRWGNVVFERKDVNQYDINSSWDGTYKGEPGASGSYVYMLEAVCAKGETFTFKGTVTLIR
jgi:gliding motility-associated-like protein